MMYHADVSFNTDLGRHLKLGEIIWQTQHVPQINLFSYTYPDFPFINHHWLFEVLIYLTQHAFGHTGLLIFRFTALFLIMGLLLFNAGRAKSALFFVVTFLFIELLRDRTALRPELLSYIFTLLTIYIGERFVKSASKLIYILPFISLIWVNSHIYFPVGIALIGIFLLDMLFEKYFYKVSTPTLDSKIKQLSIVLGLSLVATILNPNGINGALYPFHVLESYGVEITENQSAVSLAEQQIFSPDSFFFYIAFVIIFASLITALYRSRFSLKQFLMPLLGLVIAMQATRGFPYIPLISLPYVLQNFSLYHQNRWTRSLNILAGLFLIAEIVFFFQPKVFGQQYIPLVSHPVFIEDGKKAMDYVLEHKLPQPIYNNFDIGSYIIYRGYPEYKVFIDGRPEAYPLDFKKEYIAREYYYTVFKQADAKYHFKTAIVADSFNGAATQSFINTMASDPEWKLVYKDAHLFVFIKNPKK